MGMAWTGDRRWADALPLDLHAPHVQSVNPRHRTAGKAPPSLYFEALVKRHEENKPKRNVVSPLQFATHEEWKSWKALHRQLRRNGRRGEFLKISMRRWYNSASPLLSMALSNSWFEQMGLVDLCKYEVGVLHRCYEQ